MLEILHEIRFYKHPYLTPREFAMEAIGHAPGFVPVGSLSEAYYRVRFAQQTIDQKHQQTIDDNLQRLREFVAEGQVPSRTTLALGTARLTETCNMTDSLFDLHGKNALITGSNRGLGLAIARGLAQHGANVALLARTEDQLAHARSQIKTATDRTVWTFPFDLTDTDAIADCFEQILTETQHIDILVNCAGVNLRGPAEEVSLQTWRQVFDVNLNAAFAFSAAFCRHRKRCDAPRQNTKHRLTGLRRRSTPPPPLTLPAKAAWPCSPNPSPLSGAPLPHQRQRHRTGLFPNRNDQTTSR